MAHVLINCGIFVGFCAGTMVLLRPVLVRLFTAQQRVVLWYLCVGWYYMLSTIQTAGQFRLFLPFLQLPVHLYDLITTQTWRDSLYIYEFNRRIGPYYVDLTQVPYLDAVYFTVVLAICAWLIYRSVQTWKIRSLGTILPKDDPCIKHSGTNIEHINKIYVVENLPTSFVDGFNNIFLQKAYSGQQMYQIFLHEAEHINLHHAAVKCVFSIMLVVYWWNPLLWLAFRYMVRDLELACDGAVLAKLRPEDRTSYAKTLVELGCGRQLWTQPLCFGECDAQLRVKAVLKWKPQSRRLQIGRFALMALVIWFFLG